MHARRRPRMVAWDPYSGQGRPHLLAARPEVVIAHGWRRRSLGWVFRRRDGESDWSCRVAKQHAAPADALDRARLRGQGEGGNAASAFERHPVRSKPGSGFWCCQLDKSSHAQLVTRRDGETCNPQAYLEVDVRGCLCPEVKALTWALSELSGVVNWSLQARGVRGDAPAKRYANARTVLSRRLPHAC